MEMNGWIDGRIIVDIFWIHEMVHSNLVSNKVFPKGFSFSPVLSNCCTSQLPKMTKSSSLFDLFLFYRCHRGKKLNSSGTDEDDYYNGNCAIIVFAAVAAAINQFSQLVFVNVLCLY
jgi:hypothetical protein